MIQQKHFFIEKVNNNYFILRHGETEYTADADSNIYPKSTRFELGITENGKNDIKKLIPNIKEKDIDLIFASDFLRTKITSKIVADALDLNVVFDKRLRDVDLGIYAGKPKKTFYNAINYKKMLEEGPEEGESWMICAYRVDDFMKDIEKRFNNKNILIVSHGDPLWLLEKMIAQKEDPYKIAEKRRMVPIIRPGELREISFK